MTRFDAERELLFYLEEEADDRWRERMAQVLEGLATSHRWSSGSPTLVDEIDEAQDGGALSTLGGVLKLRSELPPHQLDPAESLRQLNDVEALVTAVESLSQLTGSTFAFLLDGETIGWVEDGAADDSLQVGLIDEWRRRLGV